MRTFGSKNATFDHFLTLMTLVFNGFWVQKGPKTVVMGLMTVVWGLLMGLDPQNQDFDQFLMKIIKKSLKNHQKSTFWSKIQNFPGYPRGK